MATIIILDDNKSGFTLLKMALSRHHYRVHQAANLQEALDRPVDSAPRLVLINHAFGNRRGWEIFNQLKHISGHLPALVYVLEHINGANIDWIVKAVQAVLGEAKHPVTPSVPGRFQLSRYRGICFNGM